ncbi:hypothetical protein [Actinokineospora enzanensis]|uniref:hypothetical protein n=1 Tax=Actinokineospora enzanensis TaxID=155975 RepID=UPI00035C843C|nr:hypothetical protein [Actinokineospora enzanensis]
MRVGTLLTVPPGDVRLEFETSLALDGFGRVSGIGFADGGPRVTVTLHSGDRVTLMSEMDTWTACRTGQDDGMEIEELAELVNRPGEPDAVHDVFDELWRLTSQLIEQITGHVVDTVARDLTHILDCYTTSIPF